MEALLEPGQALSPADYLRIARQLEALDEPRLRVH
ncbi:MAG: hypothetical protein JWR83_1565, partial [Aeromicrobium sp.]|nr:hypothetical protein [Aeromicrobium sp.]